MESIKQYLEQREYLDLGPAEWLPVLVSYHARRRFDTAATANTR